MFLVGAESFVIAGALSLGLAGIASPALGLIVNRAGLDSVFLVSTGVVLASVFVALRDGSTCHHQGVDQ